jgi:hypothetical protein
MITKSTSFIRNSWPAQHSDQQRLFGSHCPPFPAQQGNYASSAPLYLQARLIGLVRLPRRRSRSARCSGLRLLPLLDDNYSVNLLRETSYCCATDRRRRCNRRTNRQHAGRGNQRNDSSHFVLPAQLRSAHLIIRRRASIPSPACFRRRATLRGRGPFFERALAAREKALGPEHPDAARIREHLAVISTREG